MEKARELYTVHVNCSSVFVQLFVSPMDWAVLNETDALLSRCNQLGR